MVRRLFLEEYGNAEDSGGGASGKTINSFVCWADDVDGTNSSIHHEDKQFDILTGMGGNCPMGMENNPKYSVGDSKEELLTSVTMEDSDVDKALRAKWMKIFRRIQE
ncbi:MAG: hypothetical protein P9L92_02615 [Candidatus Electryonea clarkiae]|nr:hypothetical protein [Candidatus Electryonea clarkiae]MDP8288722.1 hypothetical protein [Candidatus Electryonea clarkiae]